MSTDTREFAVRTSRLEKGLAYPVRRCSLEAAISVGGVRSLREVFFRHWPSRPLLEAIFQGEGRNNPWAGSCSLEIGAVPSRIAKEIENLIGDIWGQSKNLEERYKRGPIRRTSNKRLVRDGSDKRACGSRVTLAPNMLTA